MEEDYENSDYEESKEERQARDDRIEEFRQRLAK